MSSKKYGSSPALVGVKALAEPQDTLLVDTCPPLAGVKGVEGTDTCATIGTVQK
ncbi:hypothetical protein [Candidatus Kuenenia stuttgartiensis]|uniref:hypothetical protein n=1 Tax=Kuenenia stuttgartiensis TaxID=174633 RepID=UPI0013EAFC0D|nr:hypothetical protein [Candidatus Kuenenia stuttgartiensis]